MFPDISIDFEYYKVPKELKELEDQKVLNTMARAVQKVYQLYL